MKDSRSLKPSPPVHTHQHSVQPLPNIGHPTPSITPGERIANVAQILSPQIIHKVTKKKIGFGRESSAPQLMVHSEWISKMNYSILLLLWPS